MGVHGLWRLIEPSGKQVPLETLENKILAVDISIWLHQAMKGFQDSKGGSVPNAHLLGVYQRLCKLLYYRIRPVFVFDGGVPALKKQTIARRRQLKYQHEDESERLHQQILTTMLKQSAINSALVDSYIQSKSNETSPTKLNRRNNEPKDDIFKLPELPPSQPEQTETSDSEESPRLRHYLDIDSIDEKSKKFKSLPPEIRHDILTEIKEASKHKSWKQLYTTPAENGEFSKTQIERVLKRRSIQMSLQEAEQEMGGHSLSLGELETLFHQEGIVTNSKLVAKSRIASDEHTRYLLIKDLRKAKQDMETQKLEQLKEEEEPEEKATLEDFLLPKTELDSDLDLAIQLSLSAVKSEDQPSCSKSSEELKFSEKFSKALKKSLAETEKYAEISSDSDQDLETAIKLSLQTVPTTLEHKVEPYDSMPYLKHFNDADFIFDSSSEEEIMPVAKGATSLATAYLAEYSDLTTAGIQNVLGIQEKKVAEVKSKDFYPNEMLLNTPKSAKRALTSTVAVSSTDDDDDLNGIGVISDSNSSDSDFVEVVPNPKVSNIPVLELVINPQEPVEDDLFADVFKNPKISKLDSVLREIIPKEVTKEVESVPSLENVTNEERLSPEPVQAKVVSLITDQTNVNDGDGEINKTEVALNENNNGMLDRVDEVAEKQITKIPEPPRKVISKEELEAMKEQLESEREVLIQERDKEDRLALNITDQMYKDTQNLLKLFGVPYIVAPMEAEAQCAYLNEIKLTDGTITDDSDIWLFGGQTVYKNFFSQKKNVLEFRSENIQHNFKLSREQFILLALLVGSDYTLGIQGVGPVTALEILAAFPPSKEETTITHHELISGLQHFKNWWRNGRIVGPGKGALRNKLKNINLLESFPSPQVVEAYLKPEVDLSREKFTWGKPNEVKLREFARNKFGWSELKSNGVIQPVIKRWENPISQQKILAFFKKQPIRNREMQLSKRVKQALHKLDPNAPDTDEDLEPPPVKRKPPRKRKTDTTEEPKKIIKKKVPTNRVPKKLPNEPDVVTLDVGTTENPKTIIKKKVPTKRLPKKLPNEPDVVTLDVDIKPLTKIQEKMKEFKKITPKKYEEFIPQREQDRINALKVKLRAIELYRKSKKGPGFVNKRENKGNRVKDDAELSESSSD